LWAGAKKKKEREISKKKKGGGVPGYKNVRGCWWLRSVVHPGARAQFEKNYENGQRMKKIRGVRATLTAVPA